MKHALGRGVARECVCVSVEDGGWGVGPVASCCVWGEMGAWGVSEWLRLCGEWDGGGGVAMDCRGVDCMCVTLLEVYT